MRYRSLALALAACIAAGPAVRADDAVVPDEFDQPRSLDACDAYGAGFAKVPGTNTCARLGGQIRFEQGFARSSKRSGGQVRLDFETRSD